MRFSDLKKKLPSLRVGVLVIAAFALLGSMMLPSISEKMGLNGSLLLAGYGYQDECDTEYRNSLQEEEVEIELDDADIEFLDCIDDCDMRLERVSAVFDRYCEQQSNPEICNEIMGDSLERAYFDMVEDCFMGYEAERYLDSYLD